MSNTTEHTNLSDASTAEIKALWNEGHGVYMAAIGKSPTGRATAAQVLDMLEAEMNRRGERMTDDGEWVAA